MVHDYSVTVLFKFCSSNPLCRFCVALWFHTCGYLQLHQHREARKKFNGRGNRLVFCLQPSYSFQPFNIGTSIQLALGDAVVHFSPLGNTTLFLGDAPTCAIKYRGHENSCSFVKCESMPSTHTCISTHRYHIARSDPHHFLHLSALPP